MLCGGFASPCRFLCVSPSNMTLVTRGDPCCALFCARQGSCDTLDTNKVQYRVSASRTSMLSAPRQIATRRLGSFLASVKATMSKHFPAETAQVSISNSHSMFRSDKTGTPTQNIKTIESEFHGVRLPNRVLSFALPASKCIQDARIMNKMLFKYKQEVHAAFDRHTPPYSLLDPAVKATESIVATYWHNPENIKVDVDPKGLCFFILRWGCREHFVSGCCHYLGATAVVTPGSAGHLLWECCILASL